MQVGVCAARGRSRKLYRVTKPQPAATGGAPSAHQKTKPSGKVSEETIRLSRLNPHAQKLWHALFALLLAVNLSPAPALGRQAAQPAADALTEAERELLARVKVETIREVTTALSAKEMQGRGTGQPGGDLAAQFIAERFKRLGLKPLGEKGSYLQPIRFREFKVAPESFFKAGEEGLKPGEDYYFSHPFSGDKDVSGRLVFVGFGIQSASRDDLKGLSVAGKVAVVIEGPPKAVPAEQWKKAKASLNIKKNLLMKGATALVLVNTSTEQLPYAMAADYLTRRQVEPAGEEQLPSSFPPFVALSDAGAEKLFAGSGTTYAQALQRAERGESVSQELKQTAKIRVKLRSAKVASSNVVGYVEGTDPKLREEAVVYTAHYDAYGVADDGRIYPGAADNALGVGEMLAVAEAMAAAPPRRSVVFLAVTGEEYGLHGSEYWVKNPTWKLKSVAADVNFDGMGTETYGPLKKIVGFGAEHSSLGAVLEGVAAATGARLAPDPMPEEKSFYRSDHYAFVKRGVPSIFLMGAPDIDTATLVARVREYEKKDYHQPTDEVRPTWDWEGPRGLAQAGALLGWRVANAEAMPSWLPSSPFNRKRGTDEPPPEMP